MPTKKPLVTVNVTQAQQTALARATRKAGMTPTQARREAFKLFCEKHSVEWPDDMPAHGDIKRFKGR